MNKKIFIALLLLSIPIIGHTDSKQTKRIYFERIVVQTRSLGDNPEAFICYDILTASFNESGVYSLYIEDNIGATVYTSVLPADGMEYDYDLSGIGDSLNLKSPGTQEIRRGRIYGAVKYGGQWRACLIETAN